MKSVPRSALHLPTNAIPRSTLTRPRTTFPQCFSIATNKFATTLPITLTGPSPAAPVPDVSQYGERVDRRRRQAELLRRGQDMRASQMKPGTAMKKRFWKDVSVQTDDRTTQLKYFENGGGANLLTSA